MVYNELTKEELEEQRLIHQETQKQLEQKEVKIKILEHKPHTYGFSCRRKGFVYKINEIF